MLLFFIIILGKKAVLRGSSPERTRAPVLCRAVALKTEINLYSVKAVIFDAQTWFHEKRGVAVLALFATGRTTGTVLDSGACHRSWRASRLAGNSPGLALAFGLPNTRCNPR